MPSTPTLISAATAAAASLIATPAAAEDLWMAGYWRNGAWIVDADTIRRAGDGRTHFTVYFIPYDAGPDAYTRYNGRTDCGTSGTFWSAEGGLGFGGSETDEVENVKVFVCASPAERDRGNDHTYVHIEEGSRSQVVAYINAQSGPPD